MHLNSAICLENPKSFNPLLWNSIGDITMDNQQERILENAWLAGLWEGDGSFSMNKCALKGKYIQYQVNIQFVNTDVDLIMEVKNILKKNNVGYYEFGRVQPDQHMKARLLKYEIRIQGYKRCINFLNLVLPHLRGIKKQRAIAIDKFIRYRLSLPKQQRYSDIEHGIYADYLKISSSTTNMPNEKYYKHYLEDRVSTVSKVTEQ